MEMDSATVSVRNSQFAENTTKLLFKSKHQTNINPSKEKSAPSIHSVIHSSLAV